MRINIIRSIVVLLVAVAAMSFWSRVDAQVESSHVLNFEKSEYRGSVGAQVHVSVMLTVAPNDTLFFSRNAIRYDETKLRLVGIENGKDVPDYSLLPFVNWDGYIDADVIWLGQWFNVGNPGEYEQWSGEAFRLTFDLVGTSKHGTFVDWTENLQTSGCGTNYLDMWPFVCQGVARYQACCGSYVPPGYTSQCGTDPEHCIIPRDFLGTTFKILGYRRGKWQIAKSSPDARRRWIQDFNARQDVRIAALSPKMQVVVRTALAGGEVPRPEMVAAAVEQSTWGNVKGAYR